MALWAMSVGGGGSGGGVGGGGSGHALEALKYYYY